MTGPDPAEVPPALAEAHRLIETGRLAAAVGVMGG